MTLSVSNATVTIPSAETLTSTGEALAYFTASSGGTLVNYGAMTLIANQLPNALGATTGIGTSDEPDPSALFNNLGQFSVSSNQYSIGVSYATVYNSGAFLVTSSATPPQAVGFNLTYSATGVTGSLVNSGSFTVQGGAAAYGVNTYNPGSWGGLVQNLSGGTLSVSSNGGAFGVTLANGGEVDNAGVITISGNTSAYGIEIGRDDFGYNGNYGVVNNSGTLTVAAASGVGVIIAGISANVPAQQFNLINSGTITAHTAVQFETYGSSIFSPSTAAAFDNSGTVNGDIVVNDVIARILNTGVVNGNFVMGNGNDVIDSVQGVIHGTITLGSGNDTVRTGAEDNTFYLGSGNDVIDGGGGTNTVVFAAFDETKVKISTQADGSVLLDAGGVVDTLTNIQIVEFANGAMVLSHQGQSISAASGPSILIGNVGADVIVGGLGADIITGGLGADTLTGGGGADTFRDTLAGLAGDTITDFSRADVINVVDASLATFGYAYDGTTLMLSGANGTATVTLSNGPGGHVIVSADAHGGVDVRIAPVASASDFNADGHSDLLWREAGGSFATWDITGNGSVETRNVDFDSSVSNAWQVQGTFDFNGDGAADILWRNTASGALSVWTAHGTAFTQNADVETAAPTSFGVTGLGDFNGDGRDDILFRNVGGDLSEWQSTGTGFVQNAYTAHVDPSWHVVGVGDFNGDGQADILWRNVGGALSEWQSTGSGFNQNVDYDTSVAASWHVEGVADFNGDGRADILWRNDSGLVSVWQSTGSGFTQNTFSEQVDNSWHVVATGDFNGDGLADIVWRNDNGAIDTWQGDGHGGFTENALVDSTVGNNWTIQTHHYDFV